jgi:hypothetical protein
LIDLGPEDDLEDAWDHVAKPCRDAAAEMGFRFLRRMKRAYPRVRSVFFADNFVNIWDGSTCLELVGEAMRQPAAWSIARVRRAEFATYVELEQLVKIRTPMYAPEPPQSRYLGRPIVDAIVAFFGRRDISPILALPGVEQVPPFDPAELAKRRSRHRTRVQWSDGRVLTFGDDPGASVDEWESRAIGSRLPPWM